MEDVDTPRVQPGAADGILRTLEEFGFLWDGNVMIQSERTEAYRAAFESLRQRGLAYACGCSRKETLDRYPGTCRAGLAPGRSARAWRVRVPPEPVSFVDRVQGLQTQNIEEFAGDFVILRADGLFAYQLAVVVDDCDQGITDVVRGADLLDSTPRQIHLQRLLGAPSPRYLHTPVAVNPEGQKLSKQTRARSVDSQQPAEALFDVLTFLGQDPPAALRKESVCAVWDWAIPHWNFEKIPKRETALTPEPYR